MVNTAGERGWADEQVHKEYFGAAVRDASGDQAFEVRIASNGKTLEVPTNKSVIKVLSSPGIDVPVSCERCANRMRCGPANGCNKWRQ